MQQELNYCVVRDVKQPVRASEEAAGLDFFIPKDQHVIQLMPGRSVIIPSGIKVLVPKGEMLVAYNKSGNGGKDLIIKTAELIDSDYTGEVHLAVINLSKRNFEIRPDMSLVQFAHQPVIISAPKQISVALYDELTKHKQRKERAFGDMTKLLEQEPTTKI